MSTFDVIEHVLTADVADNGTFTVGYPTGRTAGDYANSHAHIMFALGAKRLAPASFTVSFGASEATVTYKDSTTLPAGTTVRLQFDRVGTNDGLPENVTLIDGSLKAPIYKIDLGAPGTADADGVAASQTVTGAGTAFVINGALAANGTVTFDKPRNVVAAWTNTAVLTITGKDAFDADIVETSASGTSHTGKKAFKKVTSVTTSATVTSATVGSGDVLGLPMRLHSSTQILHEVQDGVIVASRNNLQPIQATSPSLADAGQVYAVCPRACEVVDVWAVTNTVVATADATVTVKTAAGTVGTIVIATAGSAVGTVDQIDAVANATVAAGGTIEFENDAAASAGVADYTALVRPRNGVFVAAVDSAATGTTGDVRGTYDPLTACDGSVSFALLVCTTDPGDRGVAQYEG